MLARASFAIVVVGVTAAGVLSVRQARLQTAHELTQAKLRTVLLEERLAERRAEIAAATAPEAVLPEDGDESSSEIEVSEGDAALVPVSSSGVRP